MVARKDADERLDVVLKHSFQDKTVIIRKTAKSINAADFVVQQTLIIKERLRDTFEVR